MFLIGVLLALGLPDGHRLWEYPWEFRFILFDLKVIFQIWQHRIIDLNFPNQRNSQPKLFHQNLRSSQMDNPNKSNFEISSWGENYPEKALQII